MDQDGLRDSGPFLWVMLRLEDGGESKGTCFCTHRYFQASKH